MKVKKIIVIILILLINIIGCSGKVTYQELSDNLMQNINKKWFNEWKVSDEEVKEVKKIICEINISISSNDVEKFIGFLGDKVEIVNTVRDGWIGRKEELLKDKKTMAWIKRWYFGEGKDVKQSYRMYLKKLINNKKIDAKYELIIFNKTGVIITKKELCVYKENSKKAIYKYVFGFRTPPDDFYKKCISIGINNFGDGWKIYSLLVEP